MKPGQEDFNYMIGCQTTRDVLDEEGYESRMIPAFTWAIFTSDGPMPGAIQSLFGRIFQEWFPSTGYEHAGGPELEVYPPGNVMAEDYRCEVWIPIVKR
jgi:AraC family transcriptional regulator